MNALSKLWNVKFELGCCEQDNACACSYDQYFEISLYSFVVLLIHLQVEGVQEDHELQGSLASPNQTISNFVRVNNLHPYS
jgi:hypothetical protein